MIARDFCPICNKQLKHIKRVYHPCPILNKPRLSFIESVCNISSNIENSTTHQYYQISSMYLDLYFEKINFTQKSFEIEVNYVLSNTQISYFVKSGHIGEPTTIKYDYIFELDYPDLEKTLKKIKTLALFI